MPFPDKNTDAMVTLLNESFENMLAMLGDQISFSSGDVMGAALHLVIDVGLSNVSAERLREDIIKGVDGVLALRLASKGKMN